MLVETPAYILRTPCRDPWRKGLERGETVPRGGAVDLVNRRICGWFARFGSVTGSAPGRN